MYKDTRLDQRNPFYRRIIKESPGYKAVTSTHYRDVLGGITPSLDSSFIDSEPYALCGALLLVVLAALLSRVVYSVLVL